MPPSRLNEITASQVRQLAGQMHRLAVSAFRALDDRFEPYAFIVGSPVQGRPSLQPVLVFEPPNCNLFNSGKDYSIQAVVPLPVTPVDPVPKADPGPGAKPAPQLSEADFHHVAVSTLDKVFPESAVYVGLPERRRLSVPELGVHDFYLAAALTLPETSVERHESQSSDMNLIVAVANELFFTGKEQITRLGTATTPVLVSRSPQDLLLGGARYMIGQRLGRLRASDENPGGRFELLDQITAVSSHRYETKEGAGQMIVCRPDHPSVQVHFGLVTQLPLVKARAVRKLLESTSDTLHLLCDSENVFGIGRIKEDYAPEADDVFRVKFLGHYAWEAWQHDSKLLHFDHGQIRLAGAADRGADLSAAMERLFPETNPHDRKLIASIIRRATTLGFGSLIVVSSAARSEAERLGRQGIAIRPQRLTLGDVDLIARVDGAAVMDPHGMCFAFGVVLDGLADGEGDLARGSRFNSSMRYVATRTRAQERVIAIVTSDDGSVDIIDSQGSAR